MSVQKFHIDAASAENDSEAFSNMDKFGDKVRIYPTRWGLFVDFVALFVWLYLIANSLFISLDLYIYSALNVPPVLIVVAKVGFLLLVLLCIAYFGGRARLWGTLAHILFFPFVLLFFRIPTVFIKVGSWPLAIAFINATLTGFVDVKAKLTLFAGFFCSLVAATLSSNWAIAYGGLIGLLGILFCKYSYAFLSAFTGSKINDVYRWIFRKTNNAVASVFTFDLEGGPFSQLVEISDEQRKKIRTNLHAQVFYNRICLYSSDKLMEYNESKMAIASGVIVSMKLFLYTVFIYSILYYIVVKFHPELIDGGEVIQYSDMVIQSFNAMFFSSHDGLKVVSNYFRYMVMSQNLFALMLIGVFLALVVNVKAEKEAAYITSAAKFARQTGLEVEDRIKTGFSVASVNDVVKEMENLQSGLFKIVAFLTSKLGESGKRFDD